MLISVGRRPNSKIPGLERTHVQVDERGFIMVDEQRRTDEPSIFAIGDVVGEPMLAHKASHEGRVAVEVISGENVVFAPRAIPAVVFTDPELAWAGITETQAQKEGRKVVVAKFPWGASGRALTLDRTDGLTKLILDAETERVLGVGLVGAGAGELIAEGVLAIEMGATAKDLALTIHPHPTLSETVMESAEVFFGQATHVYRPKRGGTVPASGTVPSSLSFRLHAFRCVPARVTDPKPASTAGTPLATRVSITSRHSSLSNPHRRVACAGVSRSPGISLNSSRMR